MKVTEAHTIVTCPGRNYVLYKIITDEGVYGVGDGTLNGRELAVAKTLEEYITPLLIGRDPDRIEDIWQFVYRGAYWRGGPVLLTALAAVDMALWDIKGKVCRCPVYSLLGGKTREGAWAYTHCAGQSLAEVVQEVIPGGPTYRDGRLFPSEAPGLGTDVDEAAAKRYPYRRAYLPVARRLDGAVHDW